MATDPGDDRLLPQIEAFLRVCDLHGRAAAYHHDQLITRFIREPAEAMPAEHLSDLTGAGPPLGVLVASLERVRDLRLGVVRDDAPTRHRDLAALRARFPD